MMRDERHHSVILDYLAPAIERVARLLSLSHSPFAYFAYIFYFSTSIFTPKVILVLCDHRVRIFTAFRCGCISITTHFGYPISTLPEHLHSTSLSYAETTLNSRKLVSFPLIAHYLSAGPPLPPTPPFTGRPGHTHT